MSFHAIVQNGTVYLVPASLEVPVARRKAAVPVVVLGSWAGVPSGVPEVPAAAPVAPPPPAPVPVVAKAPAPAVEVKAPSDERRKDG